MILSASRSTFPLTKSKNLLHGACHNFRVFTASLKISNKIGHMCIVFSKIARYDKYDIEKEYVMVLYSN